MNRSNGVVEVSASSIVVGGGEMNILLKSLIIIKDR